MLRPQFSAVEISLSVTAKDLPLAAEISRCGTKTSCLPWRFSRPNVYFFSSKCHDITVPSISERYLQKYCTQKSRSHIYLLI